MHKRTFRLSLSSSKKCRRPKLLFLLVALLLFFGITQGFLQAGQDNRDSQNPFGVLSFLNWNHNWNHGHYSLRRVMTAADLMKEMGVGFVRMDFLWDDIEPTPGKFDFTKYDQIVEILDDRGIKILGLLSYNAVWAAEYWNSAPDPELFTDYSRAVVNHYKDRIKYWEIWNEPDDPQYWRDQDRMKGYTELLKTVYPALKEVDPTCVILMGGIVRKLPFSLQHIYRNGGRDYFDVVNIHPFVNPTKPNPLKQLRTLYNGIRRAMERNDDIDKPIWFTEIGCPGMARSIRGFGWWMGESPSEEVQAGWLMEIYNEAIHWDGVEKIFWAFFRDTPNYFRNGIDFFGLVRTDFSKKPAFRTYQNIIRKFKS
jgi:polysaccharide biosynthesis protein PslG